MINPDLAQGLTGHPTVAVRKLFNEHCGWRIIKMPAERNFNKIDGFSGLPGLHPIGGFFRVIDFRPTVAAARIIGMEVVLHHAVVVANSTREKKFEGVRAELTPRCRIAFRRLARQAAYQLNALIEYVGLLLAAHRYRVFM